MIYSAARLLLLLAVSPVRVYSRVDTAAGPPVGDLLLALFNISRFVWCVLVCAMIVQSFTIAMKVNVTAVVWTGTIR